MRKMVGTITKEHAVGWLLVTCTSLLHENATLGFCLDRQQYLVMVKALFGAQYKGYRLYICLL
jgi:hypothetical protein